MSQPLWTDVDDYFSENLMQDDDVLEAALEASDAAGLPAINVAPNQGKLLKLMIQMQGAKRILEIGTLGGYSTIWLARALPADGRLITLEYEEKHARVATENIKQAGFADQVEVRVGAATELLPVIAEEGHIFDFIFIDANKDDNPAYMDWAIKLSHKGSTIICDNVVRNGDVLDVNSKDIRIQGTRALCDMLRTDTRVEATAVQTVGSKGYDGFIMARVLVD